MDENFKSVGIGIREGQILKPARCLIENADLELVGEGAKANHKVVFSVKHPDKTDGTIKISSAKIEEKKSKKLRVNGLWYKLDEDKKLLKNSTISMALTYYGAGNIAEMIGKTIETLLDDDGYLTIKAY